MRSQFIYSLIFCCLAGISLSPFVQAEQVNIQPHATAIKSVGLNGEGMEAAIAAVQALSRADKSQLPELLAGMDGMQNVSANWMRAAIETVADQPAELPVEGLLNFLKEDGHSQFGRRLAYELLVANDPALKEKLLKGMLDDFSLENRYDAVQLYLQSVAEIDAAKEPELAKQGLRKALDYARSIDQIKSILKQLKTLEVEIDITERLGFITDWYLIGPFDNTDESGFDVAYPPESKIDLKEKLPGKLGEVQWVKINSDEEMGKIDLTKLLDKHKGAITYAYKEFVSDKDQPAEIRIGCINAQKVWLNGELVISNAVYHAGSSVDQYRSPIQLRKGKNAILVKVCQNEQDQDWAQSWEFQLRVCDDTGKSIYSQERTDKTL
jgi:hypothetical protein